jgi:hypothetical protein
MNSKLPLSPLLDCEPFFSMILIPSLAMAKAVSRSAVPTPTKSKKQIQKPASVSGSISTKAQNGSLKDGLLLGEQTLQHVQNEKLPMNAKPIEHFINDERDFKSYVVKEYDAHQEVALKSHGEALKEIVRRASWDGAPFIWNKD